MPAKRDLFEYRRKVFPEVAEPLHAQTGSLGLYGRRFSSQHELPPVWGVRLPAQTKNIRLEAKRMGSGVDMGV